MDGDDRQSIPWGQGKQLTTSEVIWRLVSSLSTQYMALCHSSNAILAPKNISAYYGDNVRVEERSRYRSKIFHFN